MIWFLFMLMCSGLVKLLRQKGSDPIQMNSWNQLHQWYVFTDSLSFSSGWWFVRTAEEQGWVPATYLVSLTGRRDSHKALNGESKTKIHC